MTRSYTNTGRTAALALMLVVLLAPAPAHAITNGSADGDGHPYVGAIVADLRGTGVKRDFCSGSLVAPRIVTTAGHCGAALLEFGLALDQVWVSFDPEYQPGVSRIYHGTLVFAFDPSHPIQNEYWWFQNQYGFSRPDDIAVVHLDEAPPITPAKLPTAGLLETLDLRSQTFTAVGYGATRVDRTKGPNNINPYSEPVIRNAGKPHRFHSLQAYSITYDQNATKDYGGACFGDSGGPGLLGDSDVIVSQTMSGDSACRATARDYRLDTDFARQFLASQGVPVP
jgi:hypothetical protein